MVTGWPNLSNPADSVFFFILGISVTLLFLNTAVMIYFLFRFNRKRHPRPQEVEDNLSLEVLWTVIPTVLVIVIFFAGWKGFQYMRTVPPDAMTVKVTARQFSWTFEYENGRQEPLLRVPVRKPVKLLITSADVLHSLFIPAYRIKEDAVPGRRNYLWFLPDQPGSYDLFCTEYCGVGHSGMITKVEVMNEQDFSSWYKGEQKTARTEKRVSVKAGAAAKPPSGVELIQRKGCIACHSTDGTRKIGPSFKSLFGKSHTVIRDGKELQIMFDEAFLKEKLIRPEINRIKGYPPIMPSLQGQLTDPEMEAIADYLKSLR
jgi:cytochrome c oxidase subunit 2